MVGKVGGRYAVDGKGRKKQLEGVIINVWMKNSRFFVSNFVNMCYNGVVLVWSGHIEGQYARR